MLPSRNIFQPYNNSSRGKEGIISISFCEILIVIKQTRQGQYKGKKIGGLFHSYIGVNVLSKTLANLIQQCLKEIMHHDQVGFIPVM